MGAIEKGTKFRILYLYQMLMRESDHEHPITTNQLIRRLKERYDIDVNRNTIGQDLEIMNQSGLHIEVIHSTQNRYYYDGDLFEIPELKMLIDAISSAKFITERESDELITKLLQLTNIYGAEKLRRHLSVSGRVKTENEKGYYIVDAVNEAIDTKKKIAFVYTDYDAEKNRIRKNDGQAYIMSPYAMIWDGDFYYVVGYCESHDTIQHFRLDRIEAQPFILADGQVPAPEGFDVADYMKSVFRMFRTDEPEQVTLLCENDLMKYLIDQFGMEVDTQVVDEEHFQAKVDVYPSPTFYRWVFGWGGRMKILEPQRVRKEYRRMARKALE